MGRFANVFLYDITVTFGMDKLHSERSPLGGDYFNDIRYGQFSDGRANSKYDILIFTHHTRAAIT